ncbi:MAG TPA: hypothetical protein DCF84_05215 [Bacteroidetes bacterium]|nr:hypothetical protein [Bacteroidota bacterium]|tara:strand:- start:676 stop:1554 length:879 start_codon:yes stop_codon:yes gene_type:complete
MSKTFQRALISLAYGLIGLFTFSTYAQVYKVTNTSTHKAFYLAGSIHVLRPSDQPIPSDFYEALDQSDHLVIETDLSKLEMSYSILSKGIYPSDSSLLDVIPKKLANRITEYCDSTMLRAFPYLNFKPGLLNAFMEAMVLQDNGFNSLGVEQILLDYNVKNQQITLHYLESVEEQILMISKLGSKRPKKYLKKSLQRGLNIETSIEATVLAWKTVNSRFFNRSVRSLSRQSASDYNLILADRNKSWIEHEILPLVQEGYKPLVVVGAMHLYGRDGLIKLLTKRGFIITEFRS